MLSDDGQYVVSFVKSSGAVVNGDATGGIAAPSRDFYEFIGWATSPNGNVSYTAGDIVDTPDGTALYAVWTAID